MNSSPEIGGIVRRLRRLPLLRGFDDVVHQNARHTHIMGLQRLIPDDALYLGDDNAAIVVGGHGEIECADIGAFLLEGEIAAFIGRSSHG